VVDLGESGGQHTAPEVNSGDAEAPRIEVPPRHTRISGIWTAVGVAVVLGVALVIFVVQNTRSTKVQFVGASGHLPVSVLMLASAVAGALIVLVAGVSRTTQIRLSARRRWRARTSSDSNEVSAG
jgi:uncharacterized integral membrane protein